MDTRVSSVYQTADAGVSISDSGCRSLYITDSGCRSLYIRQLVQGSLHTADAGVSIKQTWGAGVSLSGSGCRSIRQQMQESLYQAKDTGVSISDSG